MRFEILETPHETPHVPLPRVSKTQRHIRYILDKNGLSNLFEKAKEDKKKAWLKSSRRRTQQRKEGRARKHRPHCARSGVCTHEEWMSGDSIAICSIAF